MQFLNDSLDEARWDRYVKWMLIVGVVVFIVRHDPEIRGFVLRWIDRLERDWKEMNDN